MKDRFYDDDRHPTLPLFEQGDKADAEKVESVIGMISDALGPTSFVPTGEPCVTCGQLAKEYKRKLYSSMALALIYLCRIYRHTDDWVHVNDVTKKTLRHNISLGGDMAKLEHWGLIYQKTNEDTEKRTSGFWKPTEEGIKFALMDGKVRSHVKFYNGSSNGFAGELIDINQALGEKFSYAELMGD
tara:strand:+ start:85 stop:642 length:558 start_codon:yes stop_codon:yes gene_type:complete